MNPIEAAYLELAEKVAFNAARKLQGLPPIYMAIESQRKYEKDLQNEV